MNKDIRYIRAEWVGTANGPALVYREIGVLYVERDGTLALDNGDEWSSELGWENNDYN